MSIVYLDWFDGDHYNGRDDAQWEALQQKMINITKPYNISVAPARRFSSGGGMPCFALTGEYDDLVKWIREIYTEDKLHADNYIAFIQ